MNRRITTIFLLSLGSAVAGQERTPRLEPVSLPSAAQREASVTRGVQFLLDDQNSNGSWGTAERTKDLNIYAPVPGAHHAFRTGVTSLCISALIEVGGDDQQVQTAIDRAETWLFEHLPKLRRATPTAIYNVWAHAYSIQALVRIYHRHQDYVTREKVRELILQQYDLLERYESVDGGWGYYDFRLGTKKPASSSISFVSGTVLIAFFEAKSIGMEPPDKLVRRAIASIHRQRKPDFSYVYGEYLKMQPMLGINRPGGSLGRSQVCNLALRLWGDARISDAVLETWLHRLFARNGWLDIGRKRPIPHESWMQVAGYFFYYGHYYAAMCMEQLPADRREEFQAHMARRLLELQEKDGSWWDYPLYNYYQQYGTALALMTLRRCMPAADGESR